MAKYLLQVNPNGSGKFALGAVRWSSPAPCVGAWACAGWRPSGAVPMPRPTAPSARLQTPTGCQYRGAVGHNLLAQAGA